MYYIYMSQVMMEEGNVMLHHDIDAMGMPLYEPVSESDQVKVWMSQRIVVHHQVHK